ncbi:MAG: MogA/MoaB family molybdenum cofactor biosynthesis protein [candidate division Zixibacteria bacterium]|nr:MogA/MoaB family molybdenum cofactor biosynthesis protein [candidate division Zixibacteria bacterium]MDH3936784.1 MogA/MoaB family molybdenum cofactor biosynthesis protein [candidate division Zixibacteria bacterium]MDH4032431.1 MogA/MoaB family molybdenum cofactor biosynthesis protein [candidate division Zixibacteria bacterium]
MSFSVGVIIMSDRAASGEREDGCLPVIEEAIKGTDFNLEQSLLISDSPEAIRDALGDYIARGISLILTSGGTGCTSRDNTPEVTLSLLDKPTPGLDEAIRAFSREKSPYASFSRAVSGVAGKSYIINMPGSPKAVGEIIQFLLPIIAHPLKLIAGAITDCQQDLTDK